MFSKKKNSQFDENLKNQPLIKYSDARRTALLYLDRLVDQHISEFPLHFNKCVSNAAAQGNFSATVFSRFNFERHAYVMRSRAMMMRHFSN